MRVYIEDFVRQEENISDPGVEVQGVVAKIMGIVS